MTDFAERLGSVMNRISQVAADPTRIDEYERRHGETARSMQMAKARRMRRRDILDRESVPLTEAGMTSVVNEMQPHPQACALILRWAANSNAPRMLAFVGDRGQGKTVGAAWWTADVDGRYVKLRELVRLHRAQWGDDHERWRSYMGAKHLVVDEVGSEKAEERQAAQAAIADLVDDRLRVGLRTLFLGNITAEQWDARMDARTADRWLEVGYTLELAKGRSMRQRAEGQR